MSKRVFAAILWFYSGWYVAAMIATMVGISPVLGPIFGVAAAALVFGDPGRLIWTKRGRASAELSAEPA